MMIDKNKQYKTRSGLPVRIYATDCGGGYPVHGAVLKNGVWRVEEWTITGVVIKECENLGDLIEVKPRIQRTYYINVYNSGDGRDAAFHYNRKDADIYAGAHRVACLEITIDCEEGEGL